MSTTTTNLSLVKPASNENVDLSVINGNYDKIDEFAGGVVQTSDVATSGGHVTGIGQNTVSVVSATTDANSKLASITVDGTSYNVPTKTSDLTNDSSFAAVVANPSSGSAIGTLSSLSVNGEKFSVPSGGDTVGWNQIQGSGVQIATVTINGTPTAVYAPEGSGGFEPNGKSYNITASKDGSDTALTLEYYVDGTQSSAITAIYEAGSSSTRDFNNLYVVSNGTTVSISSKVDSIRFNGAIFNENDEIISVTIGSATSTYTDLEEGTYTSGGGSEVEWTQVQQSGTKIAEISIDGTPQDVYAPTPTTVVANPSESATIELSSLKVGSTVYSLPSGGGSWEIGDTYYIFSFDNSNGGSLTATEYLMEGSTPTQVDTATISFASIIGGGPSYVEIDDIELRWNGTAATYNINCLVDKVQYDGTQYEVGDNVYSVAQAGTSVSNQRIDKLVQGGGGGSVVSWSQTQQSGTKIAEITIDGSTQNVYAPTVPTKTSDLTNDSNFVADASYVHTDNNYTTTEKNKLSGLVAVEANPSSGTSVGDLTSIAIGGSKYDIPSGGGGTTVVANPSGEATADLEKLQVGNTIYSLPTGEGGGLTKTTLYTLTGNTPESVVTLSDTIGNYDLIEIVTLYGHEDQNDYKQNAIYNSDELIASIGTARPINWHVGNDSAYTWIYVTDVDEFTIHANSGQTGLGIWYVYGYKFNGSSDTNIADEFDATDTYAVGDYVMHEGTLYRCTTAVTTAGAWDASDWTATTVADDFVADTSYVHTDNNYTTTEKVKLSGLDAVTANPSGTPTVELETLQVGSTIYSLPEGGGSGGGGDWTDVQGTLAAGQTSITLSSVKIKANSVIDVYTDGDVNYNSILVTAGSATIEFDEQAEDLNVMIRVSKVAVSHDIDLGTLEADKIWFYYDNAKSTVADTYGSGLNLVGNDNDSSWTTSATVCIDVTSVMHGMPSGLTGLKLYFSNLDMDGYTGIRLINSVTKLSGQAGGADTILRMAGFYQYEINDVTIDNGECSIIIPCTVSDFSNSYFYIMFFDGMVQGTCNNYNNGKNGNYDVTITAIDYVTSGALPVNMSVVTKYCESSMDVKTTSGELKSVWDSATAIGSTSYLTTAIDVTNLDTLSYELVAGSCYGGGSSAQQERWNIQIGLMSTAPSGILNGTYSELGFAAGDDFANANTNYGTQTIDVSALTGNYYFVVNSHGWNATVSNLRKE